MGFKVVFIELSLYTDEVIVDYSDNKKIKRTEEKEHPRNEFEGFVNKTGVFVPFSASAFDTAVANVIALIVSEIITFSVTGVFILIFAVNVRILNYVTLNFVALTRFAIYLFFGVCLGVSKG